MDQNVINWTMAGFGGLIGFFLKAIWDSVKDLQVADKELSEKVASIEVLVAGDYVRKADMSDMQKALFNKLDRIEEKLDKKVDK